MRTSKGELIFLLILILTLIILTIFSYVYFKKEHWAPGTNNLNDEVIVAYDNFLKRM